MQYIRSMSLLVQQNRRFSIVLRTEPLEREQRSANTGHAKVSGGFANQEAWTKLFFVRKRKAERQNSNTVLNTGLYRRFVPTIHTLRRKRDSMAILFFEPFNSGFYFGISTFVLSVLISKSAITVSIVSPSWDVTSIAIGNAQNGIVFSLQWFYL